MKEFYFTPKSLDDVKYVDEIDDTISEDELGEEEPGKMPSYETAKKELSRYKDLWSKIKKQYKQ